MIDLGDAAHATSPSSGQGASLAIEDAVVLAKCLRDRHAYRGAGGVPALRPLPAPAGLPPHELTALDERLTPQWLAPLRLRPEQETPL
jgi:hypothetical protein